MRHPNRRELANGYRATDGPYIPLKPLQEWVERQIADGTLVGDLAHRLGVTDRTIRRIRMGHATGKVRNPATGRLRGVVWDTDTWGRFRVEDMLDRAGVDFYDLYPQFAHERDDLVLEPEAWCEKCREVVTPMDGVCLWCDSVVSKWQEPEEMAA